ncbi:MAG: hypothetical protein ACTS1Z_15720 [Parasphingopyxis sp.]|uniref:hypothetical protein n=1 Tax=Parasphingopyxis sp. TaxID=1920299 RepID=UPI003FA112EE
MTIRYKTIADIAAITGQSVDDAIYLAAGGREGWFKWDISDLSTEVSVDSQQGVYIAPSGQNGSSGAWVRVGAEQDWHAEWFGSVGDNSTDCQPGLQCAHDLAVALGKNVTLRLSDGIFLLNDEWDIYRASSTSRDFAIIGNGQHNTVLKANFAGTGKTLIKGIDIGGINRCAPTIVRDIQLTCGSRAAGDPVLLDIRGCGESRFEHIRFGPCDNIHWRVGSAQNVRAQDVVSFFGGHHFLHKSTSGVTFSIASGAKTLTSSAAIFDAGDVGKTITLFGPTVTQKHVIAAYTSSTQVTVSTNAIATASAVEAHFEGATVTCTASSAKITASGDGCFTSNDVGRWIYIRGGRTGPYGEANLLAQIATFTDANNVTLDRNVEETGNFVIGCPVYDFYEPDGSGSLAADSNDNDFLNLHLENYAGVGITASENVSFEIDGKIHAEVDPTDNVASIAHIWLDDYAGTAQMILDGQPIGDYRIHISNMNDMVLIPHLFSRRIELETLIRMEHVTDAGGYAVIRAFNAYSDTGDADPTGLFSDANTDNRILYAGPVNMLKDSAGVRTYIGSPNVYVSPEGLLKFADHAAVGETNVSISSGISWNGVAPTGLSGHYTWQRIGNTVFFSVRLEYSSAGLSNSSLSVAIPSAWPVPALRTGTANNELMDASISVVMASAASGIAPSLTKGYVVGDGNGGHNLRCVLNSSSISAQYASLSGFYFTNA